MSTPARSISTLDLRARLGDLLDRVRLRFDTFVVERKGKEIAALMPVERMRRLEEFARNRAEELEEAQRRGASKRPSAADAERRLRASLERVRSKRKGRAR